ncbi:protease-4 [Rhodothalassium salexigens DSM 2132]|uniref:Protease-4 n=1 Tax=Rhodothalassium salexigens DSM 2132 TaxID=1188247 RepID=A0A4R2P9A3_RHOSA|nr:signal peptide peptidase SppA [Rhodothalassium salexigens]MBB4212466.1 protease-4 [Rhodothalassium salexigens DSM 2132]MBK1639544.1 signal peptide peptidase SppA [Rhodothalassium salexigens DSM 2132]TCP31492.1 protease-4 [Rhodothalassium salexigens DSM 2132]
MKTILKWLWSTIKVFHVLVGSVFFTLLLIFIVSTLANQPEKQARTVPDKTALVLDLEGRLVETLSRVEPGDVFGGPLAGPLPNEVLMRDVLHALDQAREDERITALVLNLDDFAGGYPAQLHRLGEAVGRFKNSGKPVIAVGESYSQAQYLIASYADTVLMNPVGSVWIPGYAAYPLYQKEALDKLKASVHVFRAGDYKSAVEPFIRNDMSPEAREANEAYLGVLWDAYLDTVTANRGIDRDALVATLDNPAPVYKSAGGDGAQAMVNLGLVDKLVIRPALDGTVAGLVGAAKDKDSFRSLSYTGYLDALGYNPTAKKDRPTVAVIAARGQIVSGEGGPQITAADSVSALLRQARTDKHVKAVVLRVDSPGGGLAGSDLIRQEVAAIQAAGKPVVASYAGVAASGGVWISANADKVFAEETTITGSIGVFSLLLTFEDTASAVGLTQDGVGTTQIAGATVLRGLNDAVEALLQTQTDGAYQRFLALVAEGRDMTVAELEPIAGGRVWSGKRAADLGLVDALGGLDDAVTAAAELAELDDFTLRYVERRPTQWERLFAAYIQGAETVGMMPNRIDAGPVQPLIETLAGQWARLGRLNDPENRYLLCNRCTVQ